MRSVRLAGAVAPLLLLTMPSSSAGAALTHDDEIKLFASTMAIARTVRETCPGILVDDRILEAIRQELHVVEPDHPSPRRRMPSPVLCKRRSLWRRAGRPGATPPFGSTGPTGRRSGG